MKSIRKYKSTILILVDILIVSISYFITAYLLTNNDQFFANITLISNTAIMSIIIYQIIFGIFETYKNITRYENGKDYIMYIFLCALSGLSVLILKGLVRFALISIKQIILSNIFIAIAMISYRVIIRFILTSSVQEKEDERRNNLLIIGAGEAAREIIKTIKTKMKNKYNLIGLIDDNPNKLNYLISGVRILGDRYQIEEICKQNKVDYIFFSIANIPNIEKREIINICQETGAKLRILPGTADIIKNKTMLQNLRNVEIDDILGREPIILNNKNIGELIENRCILVTGGRRLNWL
ncbi:MAG: hypothetical protein Q4G09_01280 [Clostridia bacterium]|nr:hypothetical protein [Clostridia bacterium]